MKLPRDLSGQQLASALTHYGYKTTRQSGSHIRLTSTLKGTSHSITIPHHSPLKLGTLDAILRDVAGYLEKSKQEVQSDLWG